MHLSQPRSESDSNSTIGGRVITCHIPLTMRLNILIRNRFASCPAADWNTTQYTVYEMMFHILRQSMKGSLIKRDILQDRKVIARPGISLTGTVMHKTSSSEVAAIR